jgi:hypothetical protein
VEGLHEVRVEVLLGNRYVVLATPPDLTQEEAARLTSYLAHRGISGLTRRVNWKPRVGDAEYL